LADPEGNFTVEEMAAGDGYRWAYRKYNTSAIPKARLICIHGIQSHAGWYEYSCRRLSQAGLEVYFVDRRGSGMNASARGDAPSFRRLLDDLAEFIQQLRQAPGGPGPIFMMAISWGGKLAVAFERRHPGLVDGLILACPGFFPVVGPTFRERLAILIARFRQPIRLFSVPLSDPELFTANPVRQRFIRHDTLSLRHATARLLVESVRLDAYVRGAGSRILIPVLLLLAGRDRIINNERTRRFVNGFASKDKQIIEYREAHHTLEFEADPERFIDDVRQWIERRL
jgi:alpha-beta hydrolase superfamily lysophospholipase